MIIGVRVNPCYKLYEIWQMKRNKKGVQEGMTVCEVLADTASPMTSSAVCFGYGSMSREAWKSNMTGSEKAMGWESFQSTNTTSVCVNGQYNAGSSSEKQPDTLTFAKWELIHFVNVLFCTASCSSVNQSPSFNCNNTQTQFSHCLLSKALIWRAELDRDYNLHLKLSFSVWVWTPSHQIIAYIDKIREGVWHLNMTFSLSGLLLVWRENHVLKKMTLGWQKGSGLSYMMTCTSAMI